MENIPKECLNQLYKFPMNINNSNKPIKKSVILFLEFIDEDNDDKVDNEDNDDKEDNEDNLTDLNYVEENFDLYNKIKEDCLNNYNIYNQKCLNDKFLEKEDYSKELEKENNSNYCKSLVDHISKKLQDNIQFQYKDKFHGKLDNIYFKFENDNNYIDFEEKDKVKDYSFIGNNKNDEQGNKLEEYNNNSGKDCVEYGLTSLKDNIIVCTKYE